MELTLIVALLILGIILIIKGGDFFVDAASWIAEISGIPKLIIGATVVSLATTLPEILVSLMAAAKGKVDMSIGNAVGSVTVNIGLIMALSLLCIPFIIKRKDYLLKSLLMLAACALIVTAGFVGEVEIVLSICLFLICGAFFWENITLARRSMAQNGQTEDKPVITRTEVIRNVAKFVFGAAGIVWGADLLVNNGSELARLAGISERIIGLTFVAVGTSLPELITTITAIVKKQSSLSVGNIIGANIIDLTLILPLCSLLSGKALPISPVMAAFDLPACMLIGCVALIPTLFTQKFQRWQGIALLTLYGGYMVITCLA